MEWQFCNACSKIVHEHEDECYWCGTPKALADKPVVFDKLQLKLDFGDSNER